MKWIKCSKKLPASKKYVLLYLTNKTCIVGKIHYNKGLDLALYGDYGWYVSHNDYEALSKEEVSHWMEIPRKPCH